MLAPIVCFVYNRADKAKRMLTSLSKCTLASESNIYIFSDGSKNGNGDKIEEVRNILKELPLQVMFKEVHIIEAKTNKGLAVSVIQGVTSVIEKYGKVIVVEDDNIVAEGFLEYMNSALDFYESNPKVWSISGYTHFVPQKYEYDVYAMGRINSYAWATWKKSWDATDWDVTDYDSFKYDFRARRLFNQYGNDLSIMLDMQMNNEINSWAIRFTYSMFKHQQMAIFPCHSYVSNIGEDGSGTHIKEKKGREETIELANVQAKFENVEIEENVRLQYIQRFTYTVPVRVKHYLISVLLPKSISRHLTKKK